MTSRLLSLLVPVLASGCVWKVQVDTRPVPAQVTAADGTRYRVPAEIPLAWRPFARPVLTVTAPGYRTVELPVPLGWGPLGIHRVREYEVSLVPVHGPAGTWTADEVP
jgi:hypothetical protein